jgi:uncharacterized membrane protein YphA (DoxX/SURF4 family)
MLNVTLWVLQFLMAAAFLAHGVMLLVPPESLIEQMNASMSTGLRIFIGVAEVAAAIGLTVPGLARRFTWLVPSAAAGLVIVMICATVFHIMRNEISSAVITTILLAIVGFITYARWKVAPIPERTAA